MADDINQNENTDIAPTIEKSGGDSGFSSFDELEAVERYHERAAEKKTEKADKKPEPKETKAKDKKDEKAAKKADNVDEETDESADGDAGSEAEKGDKAKDQSKASAPKTLKIKNGESDVEINLDATIPVKVAGKDEAVTLDELRKNYAGKVAWDARFSQLGHKEQKFEQISSKFSAQAKELMDLASKDGFAAIVKMAEMGGANAVEFRQKFLDSVLPTLEKYLGMSDDERKQADLEFENQLLKSRDESHRRSTEEQAAISALKSQVDSLQQTHQIDSEIFENTFNRLLELQQKGVLKEMITPDLVADVVVNERRFQAADDVIKELNLTLDENAKDSMIRDLVSISKSNPDLTMDDLKDVARQAWGNVKAQNLSRKIQKAQGEGAKRAVEKPAANPQNEPLSFDDL